MIVRMIVQGIISLIPNDIFVFPSEAISSAAQWAYFINHYIPMDTFLSCLALVASSWVVFAVISGVLQLL